MSNENLLSDDQSNPEADSFSVKSISGNNENEENVSGKKSAKKKKAGQTNADISTNKTAGKKLSAKKQTKGNAGIKEPKPVKEKKSSAKTTVKKPVESGQKLAIDDQLPVENLPLKEESFESETHDYPQQITTAEQRSLNKTEPENPAPAEFSTEAKQQTEAEKDITAELSPDTTQEPDAAQTDYEVNTIELSKITFQIKFYTKVGESLFVTGNHILLGNNNPEKAFPLAYSHSDYWSGSLDIPTDQRFSEDISYHYILKNTDNTITEEWQGDKIIQPEKYKVREILLTDSWNASSFVENTFYTEPFQQVFLKDNFTEVQEKQPSFVTHVFKVKTPLLTKGQTLCITGSAPALGQWGISDPILLSKKEDEIWYSASLDLSDATFPFDYKYGVFDTKNKKFIRYEDGKNRTLIDIILPEKLTVVSDGFAVLPYTGFKGAGVAIPVFSLRSENSFGVGEFTDLKLLVDWAKQVSIKLIQILPVNDTTATHTFTDSYPYAAISAYALHPLYLHLPSVVGGENQTLLASFKEKGKEFNNNTSVDYTGVMAAKWSFIKQVFPAQKQQIFDDATFKAFFEENAHWLVPYAAFCYFREKYNTPDFNEWATNQIFNFEEINKLASSPSDADEELSIYYFVQFHLHLQLKDATNYAHQNGIILKGDIPIGIYRYSCDAWQQPILFNMNMQAGAPPDSFAVKGQNWGFPTYNWQRMRKDNFAWWKNRFRQMSYYFDAFRIDHILGFFRIWSIPTNAVEGILGHFVPAIPVYKNELFEREIFFDIERFTRPYINEAVLLEIFGNETQDIISQFLQPLSDTTYILKPEFDTQRKVESHFLLLEDNELNGKLKVELFDLISNVILIQEGLEGNAFHFRITMDDTASFRALDGNTQFQLKDLYVNYFYRRQDNFWQKEAMLKLPELKRSTNMLICGEDLGMVPDCVPGVMKDLAILSLEIQRMPKNPNREFFHPNDAPYLSVVTPSTHDMSTLRGWWEENRGATQRFFINELGQWGNAPYFCEPWINKMIILQHLYSPAMWSIFQLQDLLGIDPLLRRQNPQEERINIPANPKHYWRYRMHITLESLMTESRFNDELNSYIKQSGR